MAASARRFMTVVSFAGWAMLLALALYGAAMGWLWFKQEKLLFAPDVLAANHPLARAPDIHELTIDVPGATLSALHPRLPAPKGVVFFCMATAAAWRAGSSTPSFTVARITTSS